MNALDVPFEELKFRLEGEGRSYLVEVRHLCSRSLNAGLLEHCFMDPEEFSDWLEEFREKEQETLSAFTTILSRLWGRSDWTLLSPIPRWDDPAFQAPERMFGRLCAAVLQSSDPFPVPYRDEDGEQPSDYAEACVVYLAGWSQGLLPESVRALIRWEDVARPRVY
jgi:hypothetical protein